MCCLKSLRAQNLPRKEQRNVVTPTTATIMTTVTTFVENISSVEAVEEDIVYAVDGLAVVRDEILNFAEV